MIALHEAGHATAAMALGIPVATISLEPAQVMLAPANEQTRAEMLDTLRRYIVVKLAGSLADGGVWGSSCTDYREAERLALTVGGDKREVLPVLFSAHALAGRLLRSHWDQVLALSAILEARKHLTGAEALELWERVS